MLKNKSGWMERLNSIIIRLDALPLWWVGIVLAVIAVLPNIQLGQGSVFTIHDQLDESMMNYVLTARHPGADTIPEMLGGINASGLAPSAVAFVLLYRLLPPFYAFLCTYVIGLLCGFFGMYLVVKELAGSSILAVAAGGIFCMLPFYPVYGLSQMGIPLILYAFLCLQQSKHIPLALGLVLVFGLTSHLVYTGYAVLGFWVLALIAAVLRKTFQKWSGLGFGLLLCTYLLTNLNLISEILLGKSLSGQSSYVSHREEMVSSAMPFWNAVKTVFAESAQHAFTYHEALILPIVLLLLAGGLAYKKLVRAARRRYVLALSGLVVLAGIAVFYGICKWEPVVEWKNSVSGFLHYFQMERFYWLYPAGWYLEFALAYSVWWTMGEKPEAKHFMRRILCSRLLQCLVLAAVLWPTAQTVLYNSYFYRNVNQINNGSGITGYISWESYYAEDLMQQLEDAIGRDMTTYRVAHLGISPAPALMHGFYTVDGYSNNYPLEYKHAFRQVIAGELDKNEETAVYFDKWGNRCYLFNSLTGNYWMLQKGSGVVYEGLEFDMDALAGLGCEYLFSGGEIADFERLGLKPMGYFETEDSYWGIWLYALDGVESGD